MQKTISMHCILFLRIGAWAARRAIEASFIPASNEPSGRVSVHLANAARVKYPAALLRCKFDTPSACCGVFDCMIIRKALIR